MTQASFAQQVAAFQAQHGIKRLPMSHRTMRKVDVRLTASENMQRNRIPLDELPRRHAQKRS